MSRKTMFESCKAIIGRLSGVLNKFHLRKSLKRTAVAGLRRVIGFGKDRHANEVTRNGVWQKRTVKRIAEKFNSKFNR